MTNSNNKCGISFKSKKIVIVFGILAVLGISWQSYLQFNKSYFVRHPKKATFAKLEKIRNKKKKTVIDYLDQRSMKGDQVAENEVIIHHFKELLSLYRQKAYSSSKYSQIERELEELFVVDLDEFYDLLFINEDGDIFFTIKKEYDFLSNIHDSNFDDIDLYKIIREKVTNETTDGVTFVDYDYYPASAEPASFFIATVREKDKTIGHIVLQLAINQINNILTDRSSMGKTGEIYLVNDKQLMLTQSRFIDGVTSLNKRVATQAVKDSLVERKGNKIIDDYRGKRVFSSYERFDYKGTEWIIIAEIDEDEIITDIYLASEDDLFEKAANYLNNYAFTENQRSMPEYLKTRNNKIKVDVKEVMKSKDKEILYTRGVATCTAFTISYSGKFGYLAHISPTDEVYENIDWTTKLFLKGKQTDFVGNLIANISMLDISQHEKTYLKFGMFATGDESLKNIVHKLVENDIVLSQIKILYKNQYKSVNIIFDYDKDQVWSQWKTEGSETPYNDHYMRVPDFGKIIKKVSNYETSTNIDF